MTGLEPLEHFRETGQEYVAFATEHIAPHAAAIDRDECVPRSILETMARAGLFASGLPEKSGGPAGSDADPAGAAVRHGLLHEALGRVSSSVQGILNVHHMASSAISRWGTVDQRTRWMAGLAGGEILAAIAITEPNVGSDAASVETTATFDGGCFELRGTKRWITAGQVADLFVLLASAEGGPTAFLVPRSTPGLSIEPIRGALGCRGYMPAVLKLEGCRLSREHMLGRAGFGLSHVMATSLDAGRLNLAWGCVGLAGACLEAAFEYARGRRQFDRPLSDFQLVQRQISRMMTDVHAARLMCWRASCLRGQRDPSAIKEVAMAKYFASTMVNRVAYDTLQIHGANGCGQEYPIERYFRDARIMEIIEGSTQVLEMAIARYGYQERT